MSKYASYYEPINRALENFNAQINENARRKMAAEHNLAQTQLAATKFMYEQTDPVRVLAQQEATDKITPTKINVSRNMPEDGSDRATLERWTSFKPNIGNIVGDPNAEIKPDGTLMGGDGRPIVQPKWKAQQIQNRIAAAQMFEYDEEAQRQSELRSMAGEIEKAQMEYKKTKQPQLQMKIKGMQEQLNSKTKEYENPNRQLMSLTGKMNKIDRYLADAFASGNPDKGWVETLKWQSERTQKQYNALLKATGKNGEAKGIQLKKYINPYTREVIEYPISKFEGGSYKITNPVAGGKQHLGTFVLQDPSNKVLSGPDAVAQARSFINDYHRDGAAISVLKNKLSGNETSTKFLETMDLDPNTLSLLAMDKLNPEAIKGIKDQIANLEGTRKYYIDELQQYQDPLVRKMTEGLLGTKDKPGAMTDPLGLTTGTSVGNKYKGSVGPPELITP